MEVKLYAKTQPIDFLDNTEEMLSRIASQSRMERPLEQDPRKDLFKDTIKWGHESIQEFVDYIFWIGGVSRTLLQQLARHRMASYNVKSGRHCPPNKVTVPEGIKDGVAKIYLVDGNIIDWRFNSEGEFINTYVNEDYDNPFVLNIKKCSIPLESIRMTYPDSVQVNLFMKMNGRSLRNFLKLRMSEHAQWEIRKLAHKVYDIVKEDCPSMVTKLNPIGDLKNKLKELESKLQPEANSDNSAFWVLDEIKKLM